jgi:hypothetical protein
MIEPYKVKYGETGQAWKAICDNLKALKYQSNLVFQRSLSPKTCKDCFVGIMEVVAKNQGMVPFNIGGNDEDTLDEFRALDEFYSRYKEATTSATDNTKSSLTQKKKQLEEAEEIYQVGLGNLRKRNLTTLHYAGSNNPHTERKYIDGIYWGSNKLYHDLASIGNLRCTFFHSL